MTICPNKAYLILTSLCLAYTSNTWGNLARDSGEGWDDGGVVSEDGWSELWSVESRWTCSGGSSTSKDVWINSETCGDGIKFNSAFTYWDDGNTLSGDGWSSSWGVESGWSCTGGSSTTKDVCSEICGDSKRFNSLSTYWDDGNTISGDGWSSICSKETGWSWSGGTLTTIKIY